MQTRLHALASAAHALLSSRRGIPGAALTLLCTGAAAQTTPPTSAAPGTRDVAGAQTVIVTANKRAQDIITVPSAIQSISGATLDRIGAYDLQSVINQMPGVAGFSVGNGRTEFVIRGISAITNGIGASTVGYYIDETPLANGGITPDAALFDVERIEVLRGPQGTLYGEGSLSGTIRVITRKPLLIGQEGRAFASMATLSGGAQDYRLSSSYSTALKEGVVGLRVSASKLRNGGFADNEQTGKQDVNTSDQANLRAVLLVKPINDLSFTLSHDHREVVNVGTAMNTDSPMLTNVALGPRSVLVPPASGPRAYRQAFEEQSADRYDLSNITAEWKVAGLNLVSATSYFNRRLTGTRDARELYPLYNLLFASGAAPGPLPTSGLFERNPYQDKVLTQELRLVSGEGQPIRWVLGAFYKDRKVQQTTTEDSPDLVGFGGGLYRAPDGTDGRFFRTDVDAKFVDQALFADLSADVSPDLTLSAGARTLRQTIEVRSQFFQVFTPPEDQPFSNSTSKTLFKASANYKLAPTVYGYALFSQGLRAGNVNTRAFDPRIPPGFGPDSVDNVELGLKGRAWGGMLSGSAALYRMKYKDIQLGFELAPGVSGIGNGRQATSQGVEIEFALRPASAVQVGGSYTFSDSKTSGGDFLLSGAATPDRSDDVLIANGTRLPNVPRQKLNLFVDWRLKWMSGLPGFVRLDYERVGQRDNSIRNVSGSGVNVGDVAILKAYGIANLSVGVERGNLSFTLYARNLSNTVAQFARSYDGLGNVINRPRTLGLSVDASF
jgi:outer membrane receptor protein involved in Fe transport